MYGKTILEAVREVAKVLGIGPNRLSNVLPRGGSGGATIWVLNLGVDDSDATKA